VWNGLQSAPIPRCSVATATSKPVAAAIRAAPWRRCAAQVGEATYCAADSQPTEHPQIDFKSHRSITYTRARSTAPFPLARLRPSQGILGGVKVRQQSTSNPPGPLASSRECRFDLKPSCSGGPTASRSRCWPRATPAACHSHWSLNPRLDRSNLLL